MPTYWDGPPGPRYTPRHAVLWLVMMICLIVCAVILALIADQALNPLPYRDPEPPGSSP